VRAMHRIVFVLAAGTAGLALAPAGGAGAQAGGGGACGPGARSLSAPGTRMYPETGNGGYRSVHTEVDFVYRASSDRFLPGNHVVLTDQATQCLTSFTLDFERSSKNAKAGPQMSVESVLLDGQPVDFGFVQPTYPGDPAGMEDPNPLAHEASQEDPVGGPHDNPLPPACSPELRRESQSAHALDGTPCPADKLLITPSAPIPAGASFEVTVYYSGRPGVHNDGDGGEEGWFRAPDGSLVSGEPVGTEDWMALNDYPTAKPTYTFHEQVGNGTTAIANGELMSVSADPPEANFPGGSETWTWESLAPVSSYLPQSSIGEYELSEHTGPDGVHYYEAQDAAIAPKQQARNLAYMNMQPAITEYESHFSGPYPFPSDGSVVGLAHVDSGEEETQTMISFNSGVIYLPVLWHENMHQWWGDHVTEGSYQMTFFKEGLADWIEQYVFPARKLEGEAFQAALIARFDRQYGAGGHFWTIAPSNPYPSSLFAEGPTYERPAAAYEALHQVLGEPDFDAALAQIQREYGGATITEPELEQVFQEHLPAGSEACHTRLTQFFSEWFDTAYTPGGGGQRPRLTGPGLAGEDLYGGGGCEAAAAPVATGGPAAFGEAGGGLLSPAPVEESSRGATRW
jgi:Peptidase family M1 domain